MKSKTFLISRLSAGGLMVALSLTLSNGALGQSPSASPSVQRKAADLTVDPKAETAPREKDRNAMAAITKNKKDHEAVVAAVKSKNAGQIKTILKKHGIDVSPKPPIVMRQNGFCYYYQVGGKGPVYKVCCGVYGPTLDVRE